MAIVTISRGTFSGGQTLAECIAEKTGYRCTSREVLLEASGQYGVAQEELSEALTKKPGFLERLSVERRHYLAYIRAALCKEAQDDNLVYHGHAGHLLLEGVPNVLRVRIIANMELRVRDAMIRNNLSRGAAERYIKKVDGERVKWTRFLYGVDWYDPSLYDIVINLDKLSYDEACDMVCLIAGMDQYKRTPESQKAVDDLVLATHLRAVIAADGSIGDEGIEVSARGSVVTIGGSVELMADADKIRVIVAKEPGVEEVKSEMTIRLTTVSSKSS